MGMVLKVFPDKKSMGAAAAAQAANAIRIAIRDRGTARVVAATAASQASFWTQVGEAWFADISQVPRQALYVSEADSQGEGDSRRRARHQEGAGIEIEFRGRSQSNGAGVDSAPPS